MKYVFWFFIFISSYSVMSDECPPGESLVAKCILPGKVERNALICYKEKSPVSLSYYFIKNKHTDLKVDFSESRKLNRWIDEGTYTRYFWFSRGEYRYIIGVPQETVGAVSFLWVMKSKDETIVSKSCMENSFGNKDVDHPYIYDVPYTKGKDNGFPFLPIE